VECINMNFSKDRFAVIGLGDTGLSIIRYLQYHRANIVAVYDTRESPPNQDKIGEIQLHLGSLKYADFSNVDIIVISPGVSIYDAALVQALHNGKQVIGDIELFARSIKGWSSKVIGITGSNGKTTVTTLTGHLAARYGLKTLVAGNIGTPVLDSYLDIMANGEIPQIIVLELSSFQLETVLSLDLTAATVLNIVADHLDRYRDLLEYAYAKSNIFNNCLIQVLNRDDILVGSMLRGNRLGLWFGSDESNQFTLKNGCLWIDDAKYLACDELKLVGRHNYFNVLSSLALLKACDVDINNEVLKDGLRNFNGLEHRMQQLLVHNGVRYIEDSKGTNVGAVIAGVSGLDGMVHLILGGDGKNQDFTPLRQLVATKCKTVAIIGQDKLTIAKILEGLPILMEVFNTLPEAVAYCIKNAQSGESVVLSPACASWDMFDNYKHRAQVFIESIYENIH
ncbi:MAG: UDP-N-acetylmuramoyl-L-alanine--D-glutamate ligase, partial [Burkholderiales bacterium]|nr:UDP-N-acetylmuramoyl-L-alanine--D-glutamate ligase [Burkholderiales bacterium]